MSYNTDRIDCFHKENYATLVRICQMNGWLLTSEEYHEQFRCEDPILK